MVSIHLILAEGILVATIFVLGCCIGSWLNVCIYRLPKEKSVIWPSSTCMSCLQPIRLRDNIPILSYLLLRGRCRHCQTHYSLRYLLIELVTGLIFAILFRWEIIHNGMHWSYIEKNSNSILYGVIPLWVWLHFFYHALFLSLLITASMCDWDGCVIPLSITVPGTICGLIGSMLFPWPWPNELPGPLEWQKINNTPWYDIETLGKIPQGLYPWPFWGPLPTVFDNNPILLGLTTSVTGALVGMMISRCLRFLVGIGWKQEAMGLGDADLMMMAGAFLGWQPIVIAFFVGAMITLVLMTPSVLLSGNNRFPFGPGLSLGFVLVALNWHWLGNELQMFFFDPLVLVFVTGFMGIGFLSLSYLLRFIRPGLSVPDQLGGK